MYKSKAQRERVRELVKKGKFPQAKFDEMEAAYQRELRKGKDPLPEKATPQPRGLVRQPRRDR